MKKDAAKDIKIAFFDVDGTLIDSETAVLKSLQKTLQE